MFLELMGSGVGFIFLIAIGYLVLSAFKNKIEEDKQNSCLEQIGIWAFVIVGICTWLATCVSIAKE